MLLSLIQLLVGIGVVCLLASWWTDEDGVAMLVGLAGTFAWGLASYGLFNVEKLDSTATQTEPAMALFAAALGVATFLPALAEPFELIGDSRDTDDPMERI